MKRWRPIDQRLLPARQGASLPCGPSTHSLNRSLTDQLAKLLQHVVTCSAALRGAARPGGQGSAPRTCSAECSPVCNYIPRPQWCRGGKGVTMEPQCWCCSITVCLGHRLGAIACLSKNTVSKDTSLNNTNFGVVDTSVMLLIPPGAASRDSN